MSRIRTAIILVVLIMASMIGNSFTLGYGMTARGYNVSFAGEDEIFIPQKNETVFSLLDYHGEVLETRVLNRLTGVPGAEHKWVVDYGHYVHAKNLISADEPYLMADRLFWPVEMLQKEDIYYEGYSDKELPVRISIQYFLNDSKVTPQDLLGASGTLEIKIKVQNLLADHKKLSYQNALGMQVAKSDENYVPLVVQGTMPVDLRRFSDISVSSGTVVEVGRTANASFMLFPFPDAETTLRMSGVDFELEPISITVLPQMPPIAGIDMADDLKTLYEGIGSLQQGMEEIYEGLQEVSAGTSQADQGIQELLSSVMDGLNQMELGVLAMTEGMDELYSGLQMADAGMGELFSGLNAGTEQIAGGLLELYEASDQMLSGLEQLRDQMKQLTEPMVPVLEQIDDMLEYLESVDSENVAQLLQGMMDMMDELLEWIRQLPAEEINNTFSAYRSDLSDLSAMVSEQEARILQIAGANTDIAEAAETLIEENPEGSELHELGIALLQQGEEIEMLEQHMQDMKQTLASLKTTGTLLESQVDDLVDQLIEKLEELMGEIADRYEMDPEYYEQLLGDLQVLIEYIGQMNEVLPVLRAQIADLILLPDYLDQLVEGQRMIRDGIKMVHDDGLLQLQAGIIDAESLFSLQEVLFAVEQMSLGGKSLLAEGFTPMQNGLDAATGMLSLAPLVAAQEQINAGIGSLISDGLIPMRKGLQEGVDEMLYAEEKLSRMQTLVDSYRSFADNERNTQSAVRFIMQTQAVKAEVESDQDDADSGTDKPLFVLLWERFIALFGKDS